MTLSINVTIPEDDIKAGAGPRYLERAMSVLGFSRGAAPVVPQETLAAAEEEAAKGQGPITLQEPAPEKYVGGTQTSTDEAGRLYGSPEKGKARRSKDNMAEDAKIEELAEEQGIDPSVFADTPAAMALEQLNNGSVPDAKPNSSTGGERIDPANAEDRTQDAEDEKAEAAQNSGALTLDDLRVAAGRFQKKFGMVAAMEIIPQILGCGIHEVPEDGIANAINTIDAYEPEMDAFTGAEQTKAEKPFEATKEDVIEEMLRYADKFDGQRTDTAAMPIMTEDRAKIISAALGDDIDGLSKIPNDPVAYGKAVLAFREALAKNPFKREAKK